ncbi:MAG: PKD domain-containing protein, partial [Reinekea forsetii]|nr:PKD domain-containing protein [Reinekea forsetii]
GDSLRYIDEPTRDGQSIDHIDNYHEQNDAHNNAGIFNKAFHRLATTESPWDSQYAFTLFALANQQCWLANTTFVQAAHCVMQQTAEIATRLENDTVLKADGSYWTASELKNQIRKAFAQVGIALVTATDLESDFSATSSFNHVKFTNTSRLNGLALSPDDWTYEWDFGDSAVSFEIDPTHEFATEGPHAVSLTVTEINGSRRDRFDLVITTHSDYCPVMGRSFEEYFIQSVQLHNDFIRSTSSGYSDHTGTEHKLTAGQGLDYEIVAGDHPNTQGDEKSYELWLDTNSDGQFQDSEKLVSKRNPDGKVRGVVDFVGELDRTYRLRLLISVIDRYQPPCGTIYFAEIEDYALRWEQDDANADYRIDINVNRAANSIDFVNRTDDERITSWQWDFDTQDTNGNPNHISRKKSATFEYGRSGNYEVRLVGYDALNHIVEPGWSQTVTFESQTEPSFSATVDDLEARRFYFDASASQYPTGSNLRWDFNQDGLADGTGTQLTYLFPGEGNFPVTLSIENPDNPDGKPYTKTLTVGATPYSPQFSATYLANTDGTFTVSLHNESVDPEDKAWGKWRLDWDFGYDNQIATVNTADIGQDIEHTFPGPGPYT